MARQITTPPKGARTGAVAAALGVSTATVQARICRAGGPAVGLEVDGWRLSRIDYGPGGKPVPRWARIEERQAA